MLLVQLMVQVFLVLMVAMVVALIKMVEMVLHKQRVHMVEQERHLVVEIMVLFTILETHLVVTQQLMVVHYMVVMETYKLMVHQKVAVVVLAIMEVVQEHMVQQVELGQQVQVVLVMQTLQ